MNDLFLVAIGLEVLVASDGIRSVNEIEEDIVDIQAEDNRIQKLMDSRKVSYKLKRLVNPNLSVLSSKQEEREKISLIFF